MEDNDNKFDCRTIKTVQVKMDFYDTIVKITLDQLQICCGSMKAEKSKENEVLLQAQIALRDIRITEDESGNRDYKSKCVAADFSFLEENDEDKKNIGEPGEAEKAILDHDEDKKNIGEPGEAEKAIRNQAKTVIEFYPFLRLTERKYSDKQQTVEVETVNTVAMRKFVTLLNLSFRHLLLISIFMLFRGATGSLVTGPKDVIGLKRQDVRLHCSTQHQKTVFWERILAGSNEHQTIYFGKMGLVNLEGANGRFSIDSNPKVGRYDLVIRDLQPMDAATYICIGDDGVGEAKQAQLVVLDFFSCHIPMPGNGFIGENTAKIPVDQIQATCNLQYHGHKTPRIHWRLNKIPVNASNAKLGPYVRSVITLQGTKELNGAKLSSQPTISGIETHPWWTSTQLKVNYIRYELAEVVECQAGRSIVPVCLPSCKYKQIQSPVKGRCYCVAVYNLNGGFFETHFGMHTCDSWKNPPSTNDPKFSSNSDSVVSSILSNLWRGIKFVAWRFGVVLFAIVCYPLFHCFCYNDRRN